MGYLEVAAEMGIMPSEFWGMTYGELVAFSRGTQKRNKTLSRLWAHFVASIINHIPSMSKRKRAVTADQLLGIRSGGGLVRGMGDQAEEQHR